MPCNCLAVQSSVDEISSNQEPWGISEIIPNPSRFLALLLARVFKLFHFSRQNNHRCLVPEPSAGPSGETRSLVFSDQRLFSVKKTVKYLGQSYYADTYAYFTRAICRRKVVEEKPKTRIERAKILVREKMSQLKEVQLHIPQLPSPTRRQLIKV